VAVYFLQQLLQMLIDFDNCCKHAIMQNQKQRVFTSAIKFSS